MIIRKSKANPATKRTISSIWKKITTLRTLKQIHAHMVVHGFNSDASAVRELVFACAITIPGNMHYARKIFGHVLAPEVFIWNTMIRGFSQSSVPIEAIFVYTQMEKSHVKPDSFTFPFLLKACSKLGSISVGNQVHCRVLKLGLQSDVFVRNSLIHLNAGSGSLEVARHLFDEMAQRDVVAWSALTVGYARRGKIEDARYLFDRMPERDLISWNVMVTAYTKCGDMESARRLFNEIPQRDVVSWNAMISGYVLCGDQSRAMELFDEMQQAGERPDEVTMLSLLSACADVGALDVGKRIHTVLEQGDAVNELSVVLGNALIDMYAKCGSIVDSLRVFNQMHEKDVSSWNSIIGGLAFHGHAESALSLFEEMQRGKMVRPNGITFVGVLVACSHAGKVEEGRRWFEIMRNKYKIEPNIKHYGCMVDILGRAGLLKEAFDFIEGMAIEPNAIIWRTLLGACRIHGDLCLAERATRKLLELRPDQSGDYVLLSNMYASIGRWDGAEEVRKLMGNRGVRKEPGCSLIEVNSELFHFLLDSKPPRTINSQK
ncbi:pentatricopeptide repeat-containing protein At5g15300 [Nymphaea colorata]|nr:pentatricopeptide repeat-containing protein At5g15300 [Nymphaea colorata]XP_031473504.1 pentatricopeptide repeat-containing protein At5g15300 [Nymphaea colorata]XP_031473508.1 pentatricopeptide repeat-containing protein At5g15300 [Nymphaea colorata]XP_049933164.1 pentatricopeptide repeat-containing protein At5g15300 [Nymphaea colorata]